MKLEKTVEGTSFYAPLEQVTISGLPKEAVRLIVADSAGMVYVDQPLSGRAVRFRVRGAAGAHTVAAINAEEEIAEEASFRVTPRTEMSCNKGSYAKLFSALQGMIEMGHEQRPREIGGRRYFFLVGWSRDHVYTLKAAKYFVHDVTSGLDYFLDRQTENGMFWDCLHRNDNAPAATWFGEALGEGWFRYDDGMKMIVRRVPVLADTEYVFTEGVWYAWKATGDDAWMEKQLPRLEKALKYMTSDPLRWSKTEGLVRRSFTADEWDFANPHYCKGDHRVIHKDDPTFLYHGNQSGMYAMHWRMAEMYEHLGNTKRASELKQQGEALRKRANKRLFFGNVYGHMIPEKLPEKQVYDLVGDERKRMSLSTGYTINRKMPTHAMAVKIIKEYMRRREAKKGESFAEWWTMDPVYTPAQWPSQHTGTAGCPEGEYMNGGICSIIAGEMSKASFDHGYEDYAVDILDRTWELAQRDGGYLWEVYRRLPGDAKLPATKFTPVDLRAMANRGLKNGATPGVQAWMGETDNDMRNLPVGLRKFGAIEFDVIKPQSNGGRAVLRLDADASKAPTNATIPVSNLKGTSVYFLHCLGHSAARGAVAGTYDVVYEDGVTQRIFIRDGQEIGLWWGASDQGMNRNVCRRAWFGPNPTWKTVGMYMFGWNNPRPDKAITAIRAEVTPAGGRGGGIVLAGISVSDQPVAFEPKIRSYGLPGCWAQAAVYYALAEGLAGIEDQGTTFSKVSVSPRWAASEATQSQVTLHYPASDGYCSYEYSLDKRSRTVSLDLTGSFEEAKVHCLLPAGKAKSVTVDGMAVEFENVTIENSSYVDFTVEGLPAGAITIRY